MSSVSSSQSLACGTAPVNASLQEEARSLVRHRMCTSASGARIDLQLLPEVKGNAHHTYYMGIGEQTKGWLTAAQYKARSTQYKGLSCTSESKTGASSSTMPALRLLLGEFRSFHLRVRAGALGSHGIGASQIPMITARLRAHYTVIGRAMATDPRAVLVLNYGGEWAGRRSLVQVEQMLQSCGIDAARVIFLHYNVGAMIPSEREHQRDQATSAEAAGYFQRHWRPFTEWLDTAPQNGRSGGLRLRQGYWNFYFERTLTLSMKDEALQQHVVRKALCNRSRMLHEHLLARLNSKVAPRHPFVFFGGTVKDFRGLVTLEMIRRGLLAHGRWSAGMYSFCNHNQAGSWPASLLAAGPLSTAETLALLENRTLVRGLCAMLPRVLDVQPDIKAKTEFVSQHHVWRRTTFGLVFETTVETAFGPDAFSYVTEKALKPLLNLRPFVMIGSAGTLATLRSLGFRSFSAVVNERYDSVGESGARVRAALDEAERLVRLPERAWMPLVDTLVHNQRHLLCGGLRRDLVVHALRTVSLAQEIALSRTLTQRLSPAGSSAAQALALARS